MGGITKLVIEEILDEDKLKAAFGFPKLLPLVIDGIKDLKLKKEIDNRVKIIPLQYRIKIEEMLHNIIINFDGEERQNIIKGIISSMSNWKADDLSETDKAIYIFSQIKPYHIKFLKQAFNYQTHLGKFVIKTIEKDDVVFKPAFLGCLNLGLVEEIENVPLWGGESRKEHVITSLGHVIIGMMKQISLDSGFDYKLHRDSYQLQVLKDENFIKINELWESVNAIIRDFKKLKNEPPSGSSTSKTVINYNFDKSKKMTMYEFISGIKQHLDDLFKDYFINEIAIQYLVKFNKNYIGIDKLWRSLKHVYNEINILHQNTLKNKEHLDEQRYFANIRDIVLELTVYLEEAVKFKEEKIKILGKVHNFYYEFH